MNDKVDDSDDVSRSLVERWATTSQEYARLRLTLRHSDDPQYTTGCLRQLATLRAEMSLINQQIHDLGDESDELPAQPGPTTDDRTATQTDGNRLEIHGDSRSLPSDDRSGVETQPPIRPPSPSSYGARVQLTIRFLVEGPLSTGIPLVMRQLSEQFRADLLTAGHQTRDLSVEWFDFNAGTFDGQPIRFEVFCFQGSVDRTTKRIARCLADVVVVVVDSAPAAMTMAYRYMSEVLEHRHTQPVHDRPGLTVFADRADAPGALHADLVAAELLVDSSIQVVSTVQDRRGFLYGFAMATGNAVKRVERRDREHLARTPAMTFDAMLVALGDPNLTADGVVSAVVPQPVRPPEVRSRRLHTPPAPPAPPAPPVHPSSGPGPRGGEQPPLPAVEWRGDVSNGVPIGGAAPSSPQTTAMARAVAPPASGRRASALRRLISALRSPAGPQSEQIPASGNDDP